MNATHTPGPWHVDDEAETDIWIGTEGGGHSIARLGDDPGLNHAGHLANARLMAAAPDLLDLAFRFVECMSGQLDYGMPHTDEDNPDCQNMRQALALIAQITDQPALCECKHCTAERRANVARCSTYEVNREAIDPAGKNRHIERRCSLPPGHLGAHEYGAWVRV